MWLLRYNLRNLSILKSNDFNCTPEEITFRNYKAEKVLLEFYSHGGHELRVSEDVKKSTGTLIELCLPALYNKMELESDLFPTSSLRCACQIRSGLQYLLDGSYRHFPTVNGLLETSLMRFQSELYSELNLAEYDKALSNYVPDFWSDTGVPDSAVTSRRHPNNHVWWRRREE